MERPDPPTLPSPTLTPLVAASHAPIVEHVLSNAMCSKKAREALRARLVLVGDSPGCDAAAAALDAACAGAYDAAAPHSQFSTTPPHFKDEYFGIFQPRGYDIAGLELEPRSIAMLLSLLRLSPADRFLDLGSASGRLVLATALLTPVGHAAGVELSPSRTADAQQALARLSAPTLVLTSMTS